MLFRSMYGTIDTGGGTDTITVGAGLTNGNINGGDGGDTITINGTMTGSTIDAGAGNDTISVEKFSIGGGGETPTIIGGVGTDTFNLGINGTTSGKVIIDFNASEGDVLNIKGYSQQTSVSSDGTNLVVSCSGANNLEIIFSNYA